MPGRAGTGSRWWGSSELDLDALLLEDGGPARECGLTPERMGCGPAAPGQVHRTDGCHQEQQRGDLEGQQEGGEELATDGLHVPGCVHQAEVALVEGEGVIGVGRLADLLSTEGTAGVEGDAVAGC